ncbi:hypothetical protein BDY21DRAFT_377079 [Lineolata rhizophorae]|uniref:Uncharacterized protein n=1 Tax=Lineolata rhizophorae TaxID=578093 RepID=A0A6A6P8Y9_9PEZI|nr:hypothetical protein BDY21DRAFT_377079 [Lineolata rhizophorae]
MASMEDPDAGWKPSGRPQSTMARNFSATLDEMFGMNNDLDELSRDVYQKKIDVVTRNQELEALEARLRETEERLKKAGAKPAPGTAAAAAAGPSDPSSSSTSSKQNGAAASAAPMPAQNGNNLGVRKNGQRRSPLSEAFPLEVAGAGTGAGAGQAPDKVPLPASPHPSKGRRKEEA